MKALIVIFILIAIFGVTIFFLPKRNSVPVSTTSTDQNIRQQKNEDKIARYTEYSQENFEKIKGDKVLFFYANWCPTCIPADKIFQQNQDKIPQNINLIRINYNDTNTDQNEKFLAQKYEITYQHTFVQINENGDIVTKWNGGGITELLKNIKN